MRILELIAFGLLLLHACSIPIPRKRSLGTFGLPGAAMLLVIVQVLSEGPRWQIVPLYAYAAVALAVTAAKAFRRAGRSAARPGVPHRNRRRWVGAAIAVILLAASYLPAALFPIFRLPEPSGPFRVGTRRDLFVSTGGGLRGGGGMIEVSVQTWYPAADIRDLEPARYWENAAEQGRIVSRFWGGLPSFLFGHFSLARTHSLPNAPLSDAQPKFPVLIFNHGSIGLPSMHTVMMEDVASHGYIVVSIGHADYIPFFILPDGRLRAFDPGSEEIRSKMAENTDPGVRETFSRMMACRDRAERSALYRRFLEKNPRNQASLRRWAAEISFAVDRLRELDADGGFFSGRMDLERLGVFGVSFGGAAAVQACLDDPRSKAGVNIDGPQFGDLIDRAWVRAFFDRHLKGRSGGLLDEPAVDHPEVEVRSNGVD